MGCEVCIGFDAMDCDFDFVVLQAATVRARKSHRCCECRESIPKGSSYEYIAGIGDDFYTAKTCLECAEIRDQFSCDNAINHGDLWQEMRDTAFPNLTTASECFTELSVRAKSKVLAKWREWKFSPRY